MKKKFKGSKTDLRSILSLYGFKARTVQPVKDGIINSSFLILAENGKQYVLRVYQNTNRTDKEITNELNVMEKFRSGGIPVPGILENIKGAALTKFTDSAGNKWRAILMKFVKGSHLAPNQRGLVRELALIQAKMHAIAGKLKSKAKVSSFNKMVLWLESESKQARRSIKNAALRAGFKKISGEIISAAKKNRTEIAALPFGQVHLDYDSNNVIVAGNRIKGVLDFDDISQQPFILDTANSLWWWLFFNKRATHQVILKDYFKGYAKGRRLNQDEKDSLPLFVRMRNATLAALLFVNNRKKPDNKSLAKAIAADKLFKSFK